MHESDWLKARIKEVKEEVAKWPKWMIDQGEEKKPAQEATTTTGME
jgi:hypothetical protein